MPATGENRAEISRRYKENHPNWWRLCSKKKARERSRAYMARKRQDPAWKEKHREAMRKWRDKKREYAEVEAFLERWNAREDERIAKGRRRRVFWSSEEEFYRLIGAK